MKILSTPPCNTTEANQWWRATHRTQTIEHPGARHQRQTLPRRSRVFVSTEPSLIHNGAASMDRNFSGTSWIWRILKPDQHFATFLWWFSSSFCPSGTATNCVLDLQQWFDGWFVSNSILMNTRMQDLLTEYWAVVKMINVIYFNF